MVYQLLWCLSTVFDWSEQSKIQTFCRINILTKHHDLSTHNKKRAKSENERERKKKKKSGCQEPGACVVCGSIRHMYFNQTTKWQQQHQQQLFWGVTLVVIVLVLKRKVVKIKYHLLLAPCCWAWWQFPSPLWFCETKTLVATQTLQH